MACALTVLAVLALPLQAQAQTEIWSATFTPAAIGSGFIGCDNEIGNILRACSTAAVLSDDDFTHDSTDYSVIAFFLSSGNLTLRLDTDITIATTNGLTLVVGSTSFAFAAASFGARYKIWTSTGLSWTAGTAIAVKLTAATPPVTNTPATGVPTITGTAQVGQTLTAVTTGIMDADGLTSPTYTYQWIRVNGAEADISGAMSSTYTLVDADLGKTLTVRVRFDDDGGNPETLTSEATATVVAATVAATAPTVSAVAVTSSPASGDTYGTGEMIRFTVTFDQDVTVTGTPEFEFCLGSSSTVSCSVGTPPPALRSAALSSGSGTTALVFSYTVVAGDMDTAGIWIGNHDRTIKLDAADAIQGTVGGLDAVLTHAEVGGQTGHKVNGAAANTAATGAPTITGTAQVGQTLTAVTTGITDADGLTSPTYTYQWIRVNGAEADISGAMSSTYTLGAADLGKTLTVRVRFDDDGGNPETLTSAATATVVAAATAPTVSAVAVTSSPASGDTYGTGEMIRFTVTFDQSVTVTGTPEFEFCLGNSGGGSCTEGSPPPTRRRAALSSGSGTTALVFSYTVVAGDMDDNGIWIGDQGRTIKLDAADAIRGTGGGLDAVLTHAEVGGQSGHKVNGETTTNTPATGAPTITGTAQVDQTLTAVTTGIMDDDGLTSVTYTYQWIRVNGAEADIAGALSSTYTLGAADLGKTLTVRVRFDDDGGNPETLTSAATATVTGAVMAVCAVPSLSGRTVIWTGAMTVAVDPTFPGVFGFERERFGSLDDQTFTVGANDYTTQQVSLRGNVLTFATTNSALTAGEQAVLRLHVCAADLDFSAATGPTGDHGDLLFATTGLSWSSGDTITLRLSLPAGSPPPPPPPPAPSNAPPVFPSTSATGSVAEHTAAATNIGAVIPEATDADSGDTLTYSMEGPDAASFNFNASTRQITTKAGVTYDHEAKSSYSVTIKVDDGHGGMDTVAVTITITDVDEPPSAPAAPTVSPTSGSTTSLTVRWTAPPNTGKPAIDHYDLRYRQGTTGNFTTGPQDVAGTRATIGSLTAGTSYQVQVRATNAEGDSGWSSPGTGTPGAGPPPPTVGTIPDQTLRGGARRPVDVAPYFRGAALTYTAQAADARIVTVEVSGSTVTLTPVDGGRTTVTVTAQGPGGTAAQTFAVDRRVVVAFAAAAYDAREGGPAVAVPVRLDYPAVQGLVMPITGRPEGSTAPGDYTVGGLDGATATAGTGTLTFPAGATEQTLTVTANADADGDDEAVALGFGPLPAGVDGGAPATARVTLTDQGLVPLTVSFAHAAYTVTEGGAAVRIGVALAPAADRRVTVPLEVTWPDGPARADVTGVPASIVFEVGMAAATIAVTVPRDEAHTPDERLVLRVGALPAAVRAGAPAATTVTILQARSASAFERSLAVTLAVTARAVAESAQSAIAARVERYRQVRQRARAGVPEPQVRAAGAGAPVAGWTPRVVPVGAPDPGAGREAAPEAPQAWHVAGGPGRRAARTGAERAGVPAPPVSATGAWAHLAGWAQRLFPVGVPDPGAGRGAGGPLGGVGLTGAAAPTGTAITGAQVADRLMAQVAQTSVNLQVGNGGGAAPSAWTPVVWGQGELQRFSGTPTGRTRYGGNLQTAQVGVDLYTGAAALAGVAYLRSWGAVDYTDAGVDGVLDPQLHTVHPYLYWQPHDRISAWGLGGLGVGQVDVTEDGWTHDAPATFQMVAGGVRAGLLTRGATDVGLRADVFAATLGTRAAANMAAVDGDARRGRVMLELAHDRALVAGRSLRVQVEAGGRIDDGDADQGAGAEVGARLGFLDAGSGLDVAVHGRMLLVHESDYRDWGVRVQASWDPGRQARGLRLSLLAAHGQDAGGRTSLWHEATALTAPGGRGAIAGAPTHTDSEVAYGLPAFGGLLTPYSRLQVAGHDRALRVGTTWSPLTDARLPFRVDVAVLRQDDPRRGIPTMGVLAQLRTGF